MLFFVARRLLYLIPVLIAVSLAGATLAGQTAAPLAASFQKCAPPHVETMARFPVSRAEARDNTSSGSR